MGEKITRENIIYDVKNMIVTRWGYNWAYWRYDVSNVPDEVKLYCLKGFIDDLQDCTTSIKKSDYKDNEDGQAAYRFDCRDKRRELEKHINAGTRPRVNASERTIEKAAFNNVKNASKVVSLEGLIVKKTMYPATFTAEDEAKLQELMAAAVALQGKNA